ncbi:uncharacterized protein VTP21DRAFT_9888 [Calcarisporiella thermophila]|uniref:uncharacterized protein n=1 Tax=Calcarisporiella thermophila TaxID=911321 RepID=UPI0037449545
MSTLSLYKELLDVEVFVDIERLRDSARRYGVPEEMRGIVWKYLLGVESPDRSKEITRIKAHEEEYNLIDKSDSVFTKRIRGELSRYSRRLNIRFPKELSTVFENVVCAYLVHTHSMRGGGGYTSALVSLCGPFVFVFGWEKEMDIYYCFEMLMQILSDYSTAHPINERVASFITLFRTALPDLYMYFDEEEVNDEWITNWLQYLLSKELRMENLLRLWDTYFSISDFLDFHPYVCLAILKHFKEDLEELEHSEIRTLLMRLPLFDMEQIINQAFSIRSEILERQILDYV